MRACSGVWQSGPRPGLPPRATQRPFELGGSGPGCSTLLVAFDRGVGGLILVGAPPSLPTGYRGCSEEHLLRVGKGDSDAWLARAQPAARRDRGRLADARRACQDGAVVVADRRRAPALRGVPPRAGRRSGDEPALAPAGGRRRADRPLRRARWRARLRNGGDGGGQDDGRHLPNDDRGARGGLRGAWAVAAGARRRCAGHRGVRLVGPGWGPRAWPDWRARTAPGGPEAPTRLADRRRAGAAAAARARRGPGHDRDGVGLWDGRELGGPRRGRHRADRRPGRADDRAGLPGRGAAGAAGAARGGGGRCRGGPDVGRRTFGGRRRGGDSIPRVSAGGAGGTGGGEPGTGEALEASVVIPAHNAAGTLHRCLTALREEGVPGRRAE